jgi:peptidoglycan biosynthesis protein MviN/MurJ (putative lipid II flippase)
VFAKINAIHVTMQISLLLWLTPPYGLQGAAWAFLLSALVALPVNFAFITRYLDIRPWSYITFTWRPLAAAGLMYYIVRWVAPFASTPVDSSLQALGPVAACILIGVSVYVGAIVMLWLICGRPTGAETAALDTIRYHGARLLRRFSR